MRARDWQSNAWRKLLEMVRTGAVQMTYRGDNDNNQPLYELKKRDGSIICSLATERELAEAIIGL